MSYFVILLKQHVGIRDYIKDLSYERFREDIRTQDAVVRNLEIIGEAVKNLSSDVRKEYPEVSWKKIAGVRDRLIHHYFGVNLDIVWNIVKKEFSDLKVEIERISQKIKKEKV